MDQNQRNTRGRARVNQQPRFPGNQLRFPGNSQRFDGAQPRPPRQASAFPPRAPSWPRQPAQVRHQAPRPENNQQSSSQAVRIIFFSS